MDEDEGAVTSAQARLYDAIEKYVRAHDDDYAGQWMDPDTGEVVIAFVGSVTTHRQRLRQRLGERYAIRLVERERSWNQLLELQQRVDSMMDDPFPDGTAITGTSVDPEGSVVVVGLLEHTPEAEITVRARFPNEPLRFEQKDYAIAL